MAQAVSCTTSTGWGKLGLVRSATCNLRNPYMLPPLEKLFRYHRPTPDQADRYTRLRAAAGEYAALVAKLTPPSAEQTLAIRKIHEASMQANSAIAVNELDADGN